MRTSDLIAFALSALRRQKLRTALTILGVMIGTATLVVSISIGLGVDKVIDDQFRKADDLRRILVWPSNEGNDDSLEGVPADILDIKGQMSSAKRERIRKLRASRWKRNNAPPAPKPLNRERIEQLRHLPHVLDVIPELDESGRAFLIEKQQDIDARIYGVPYGYAQLDQRLEAGGGFSSPDAKECLVHEYMLYRGGVRNDSDVQAIIGKQIRIELTNARRSPLNLLTLFDADRNLSQAELSVLEKTWKMLPEFMESIPLPPDEKELLLKAMKRKRPGVKEQKEKTVVETFNIVGVLRAPMKGDKPDHGFLDGPLRDSDIIIPSQAADRFFIQLPNRDENGYQRARIVVDHEDNLDEVIAEVKRMGLSEYSLGLFVQQMKKNSVLIGFAMDFIALVALVVAALGIMNTMFTTVLERTREIGILKAIGAKDRHVLLVFLIEGGLIGLIGGLGGILLGWLASLPGDDYALHILKKQGHNPLPKSVFLYPLQLLIAVPLFAMLMTTLAALLPARRAARVEPVIALRHE